MSQATVRNSTLWASDPKQQLAYLAVKRWARLYCPDVILGVYTPDELQQDEYIDNNTGRKTKNVTDLLKQKIAEKKKAREEIKEQATEVKVLISEKEIIDKLTESGTPESFIYSYFKSEDAGSLKIEKSFDELSEDKKDFIINNTEKAISKISAWVDANN
jgi:hypothetical protein